MAVGDVITGLSAANTALTFQPAAGVEVMVTAFGNDNQSQHPTITDGSLDCLLQSSNAQTSVQSTNSKIMIDNDNYLVIPALGAGGVSYYGAIQIG